MLNKKNVRFDTKVFTFDWFCLLTAIKNVPMKEVFPCKKVIRQWTEIEDKIAVKAQKYKIMTLMTVYVSHKLKLSPGWWHQLHLDKIFTQFGNNFTGFKVAQIIYWNSGFCFSTTATSVITIKF